MVVSRRPFIRFSKFGEWGRFGNQLFEYAYLRIMAERLGCDIEIPDWVGPQLFNIPHHPMTNLPARGRIQEAYNTDSRARWVAGFDKDLRNFEVTGYFQYHTSHYRPYKRQWQTWFAPREEVRERLRAGEEKLKSLGNTLVGLHIRRGDYGRREFYITPVSWYRRWLDEHWSKFDRPVLFVATEDPNLVEHFAQWDPQTTTRLGVELKAEPMPQHQYLQHDLNCREPHQLDFYPDFYFLSLCQAMMMPNSTYSFAAAMIGSPTFCWRSSLRQAAFVPVDPWNEFPLTHDMVADYPHIDGISMTENPYWK
jgi:hypothetical protein